MEALLEEPDSAVKVSMHDARMSVMAGVADANCDMWNIFLVSLDAARVHAFSQARPTGVE